LAFNATVIKVMIASPSDVATERDIVEKIIHDWNDIHSTKTRIVMLPVRWEKSTSPIMGDRPQAIINKQVLEDSDLLIGIFWTKLGSPTGTHPSGTIEEIDHHLKAGKPVMLYFSSVPVKANSIDTAQYDTLLKFRKDCETKGLLESYESFSEFHEKLQRQLILTIYNNEYIQKLNKDVTVVETVPSVVEQSISSGIPSISNEAKTLLREVSLDKHGIIMKLHVMSGLIIQTNGKQFCEKGNRRSEAASEAALEELLNNGLVQAEGYEGEVFSITHEGYRIADLLPATESQ
jgi:hypothetical protein